MTPAKRGARPSKPRQSRPAPPSSGGRVAAGLAVAAFMTAVGLQVVFVQHAGALWRDEINSVHTAAFVSLPDLWRRLEFESTPVLSILFLRVWDAAGGDSDNRLRLFGVLCGLTLPASLWIATRRLTGAVPALGLALLAVNPEVIRWASSVRAWGLGAALAVMTTMLVREVATDTRRRIIAWATVAAILSVQCTYQNAVLVAAALAGGLAVALRQRSRRALNVLLGIGLVSAASLVPYVGVIERRSSWNALNQGPVTIGLVLNRLWDLADAGGPIALAGWIALVTAAMFWAVQVVLRDRRSADRLTDGVLFASVTLVASVAATVALYLVFRYSTQAWYYVPLLAVVAVCAETIVAEFTRSRPAMRTAVLAIAAVVLVAGVVPARTSLLVPQTNVDDLAAQLTSEATADDLVVVNPWFIGITLARYYHGPAEVVTLPPIADLSVHRFDLVKQAMTEVDPLSPVVDRMTRVLKGGHRVWVVGTILTRPSGSKVTPMRPAPLPDSGWSGSPYLAGWTLDAGDFLRDHVEGGRPFEPRVHGWPLEDVTLGVFWGWRP